MTNPNILVAQIYKAKYFPNETFLDSQLGFNPSFIWRSIWEAKLVIVAGARWKVGSGNKINISGQPWLKDESNPFITSNNPSIQHNTVSSLMRVGAKEWDEDIIKDLFNDTDQDCIRQATLNDSVNEDCLYWKKEISGLYSVRSVYRLLQAQKCLWQREDDNTLWRKVWKIKAPQKL